MVKQLFELTDKIQPNVQFFRLLALMVLASVVISKFPWMNSLLARVINMPDVRHNIVYQNADSQNVLAKIDIVNLGQVKADNVLLHFYSRDGKINQFFIESQDSYEIKQQELENGLLNVQLQRLAPGARILIEITGQFDQSKTFFSVTCDQGTSISTDLPSFSSQVQGYSNSMTSLYDKTTNLVEKNLPIDEQKMISWGNGKIIGFSDLISLFNSDDFKTTLSAIFILSLLIGLFLPHLAWLIPFIAAAGIGLLANFQLSLGFIIALTLITVLPALPSIVKSSREMIKNEPKEGWILPITWILAFLSPFAFWNNAISARWLAIPSAMLVLYALLLISIIIPKERNEHAKQGSEHRLLIQTEQSAQDSKTVENLNLAVEHIMQTLENFNSITEKMNYRLDNIDHELAKQHTIISQASQKYSALLKVIRKNNVSKTINNEGEFPTNKA
jgi:hypothetical protein